MTLLRKTAAVRQSLLNQSYVCIHDSFRADMGKAQKSRRWTTLRKTVIGQECNYYLFIMSWDYWPQYRRSHTHLVELLQQQQC